ncbi:MAG: hypothetical protein SVC26_08775, partial [Pseudomonadota bacterium]|nr:hypothetical protein [Pseudomonadota bacterium]
PDRPLSKAEQKLLSKVKKQVVRSANELSVDPQVVMSKRYSLALYRAVIKAQAEKGTVLEELLPEYLLGWRFDQVVKPCVSIIKQELESL